VTPPRRRPSITGGGNAAGPNAVLRFMNRRITTYRGKKVNDYGDVSDVGAVYLTNVPAAIAEVSQRAFDPATQRMQIIRAIKCAVPGWADVVLTDTLLDPFTGWFYMIEDLQQEPGIGYYPPRKLMTLRMRSGVSVEGELAPSQLPAEHRLYAEGERMSFGFAAIGTKDEVTAQLGQAQIPAGEGRFNEFGTDLRDLLVKHFGQETATAGPGYEYRYVVKAGGHGGGSSPLSVQLTIEPQWIPMPAPDAEATE
jgi:hypothetical protein